MYSDDRLINELALIIVNDVDGSQCKVSYETRVSHALGNTGPIVWRIAVAGAIEWVAHSTGEKTTCTQMQFEEAVRIVEQYYLEHVAGIKK